MDGQSNFESFLSITENRSKIWAVIVAMVRDFTLAEDLFQETVLEILKSSDRFDRDREFTPWASAIARNVVRRHWRRQSRAPNPDVQQAYEDLAVMTQDEDPEVWRRERVALHDCLQKMPERMRTLFILRYSEGFVGTELAQRSDVRTGSLRTTLARLRQRLRNCIDMQVERPV